MRRRTCALFVLVLFTLCLSFSVFAGGQQEEGGEEKVTIVVQDWLKAQQGSKTGDYVDTIDAGYMAKYPNVKVVRQEGKPFNNDEVTASIMASDGPDSYLIIVNGQDMNILGEGFAVLDDYVEDLRKDFPEGPLTDCTVGRDLDNGLRGLPVTVQGWTWYYNKSLYRDAGLDPENPSTTWDGLLEASEKLKSSGVIPVALSMAPYMEWAIAGSMDHLLSLDEKKKLFSGDVKFTDSKIVDVFAKFQELFEKGYMDPAGLTLPTFRDSGEKFMAQKTAIFRGLISDTYNWKEFGDALGEENLGTIPNFSWAGVDKEDTLGVAGGITYVAMNYSKNLEETINYIKWTASPEGQQIGLDVGGFMVPSNKVDRSGINSIGKKLYDYVDNNSVAPAKTYIQNPQWAVIRSHAPLLFSGEITPEEYAQAIEDVRPE